MLNKKLTGMKKIYFLLIAIIFPFIGFSQKKSIPQSFTGSQIFEVQSRYKQIKRDIQPHEKGHSNQKPNILIAEQLKDQGFNTSYGFDRHKNIFHHNYLNLDYLKSLAKDTVVLDSVLEYNYITGEDSVLIFRESYEYSPNGFLGSRQVSSLDTLSGKLINEERVEFYSNESGSDTLIIYLNWDRHYKKWTNIYEKKYFYSSDGKLNYAQLFEWDRFNSAWIKREMIEVEYNEADKLISRASYVWNTSTENWRGTSKLWSDTVVIANGYIERNIEYTWNNQIRDWDIVLRSDIAINNEENIDYEATYTWNKQDSAWIGELKTEYYFNPILYEQGVINYIWDTEFSDWVQNRKTIENFNDSWQLQSHSNYLWENEQWILLSKTEHEYNDRNKRIRITEMQRPDTLVFSKLISGFNSLDDIAGTGGENSCPDKTCLEPDTGLTVENSVIKWNYNINKANFYQGYVQLEIDNEHSLKGDSAISFSYKTLTASNTWFDIILIDADGEEWLYSSNEILNDTVLEWKQMIFPFKNFKIPLNALHANNKLDLHQIDKIVLRIKLLSGITAGGSIQLDNLGTFKVGKTDNWFPQAEERLYYDNNNLVADTSFTWDSAGKNLIPVHCGNYEYDENNNQIVSELFNYSQTNGWTGESRIESVYNSENLETGRITYNWSMNALDWIPVSKEISTYNNFSWQTSLKVYVWDDTSNSWFLMNEITKQFDVYGTQVMYSYMEYNTSDSTWYGNKSLIVLNINNEPIQDLYYQWNSEQNDWELTEKYNRTKVEHITKNELRTMSILREWNETLSGWTPTRKRFYFYTQLQIGTIAKKIHDKNRGIIVYPNPARDFIKISLPENQKARLSIFNTSGQLWLEKILYDADTNLKISGLDAGLYFIKIETDDERVTEKIIIQK